MYKNLSVVDPHRFQCGSGYGYGYGSSSRVLMTKKRKNLQLEKKYFFKSKMAFYLSLGLHKGRPSFRRSLHISKENI